MSLVVSVVPSTCCDRIGVAISGASGRLYVIKSLLHIVLRRAAKHGHGSRDSQSHEPPAKGLASSTWRLNLHDGPAGADDSWSRAS